MDGMSEMEKNARAICEEKGYDPDYPTGEATAQWQSFTELASERIRATAGTIQEG